LAAATVGGMALAAGVAPILPGVAAGLLTLALLAHVGQAVVLVTVLRGLPDAARDVNPTLHLTFVAPIVGGLAAVELGWTGLAGALFWATLPVALLIWGQSALQFAREVPPAPLRPMLAIHLAPASLLATIAALTGLHAVAVVLALAGGVLLGALVVSARWVTASGFSPIWGALTFPLAAYAGALFHLGWLWPATLVLIAALGLVPAVAWQVLKLWPDGRLAARTNAAQV
jgi:tellurite resistance protein